MSADEDVDRCVHTHVPSSSEWNVVWPVSVVRLCPRGSVVQHACVCVFVYVCVCVCVVCALSKLTFVLVRSKSRAINCPTSVHGQPADVRWTHRHHHTLSLHSDVFNGRVPIAFTIAVSEIPDRRPTDAYEPYYVREPHSLIACTHLSVRLVVDQQLLIL
jgi:hypothetical protein